MLADLHSKAHERSDEGHPMLPSSADVNVICKTIDGLCGARKRMIDLPAWKATGPWVKQHIENGQSCLFGFPGDLSIALPGRQKDFSRALKMNGGRFRSTLPVSEVILILTQMGKDDSECY